MLEIYRGASGSFTLYEDDGESLEYLNGAFAETDIEVTEASGVCTCAVGESRGDFARSERTVLFNIHSQPRPRLVKCNTVSLDPLADLEALAKVQTGWWWDEARRVLTIKSPRHVEMLTVQVS